jgi:transcriptional regulator with XRE-family HTH domain
MTEDIRSSLSLLDNPFKRRRTVLGLTQKDLGRRAGVSPSTVTEVEVGLFRKPPAALLRCLSSTDADERSFELSYYTWVIEVRAANKKLFKEIPVISFTQFMSESGGSLRGFCRNLVVQRSLVQDYIKHKRNWDYLSHCLYQVNLSEEYVQYLYEMPTTSKGNGYGA